jgi:hypothetical protein
MNLVTQMFTHSIPLQQIKQMRNLKANFLVKLVKYFLMLRHMNTEITLHKIKSFP